MKKGGMTAAELLSQLQADPEYLERRAIKEAETEILSVACRIDETELVRELNEIDVSVNSVWDLVNNQSHPVLERSFTSSYEAAYPILVKHLSIKHHERIREGIIRSLTEGAAYSVAAKPLIEQFEIEPKKHLRWVIANALESMLPKEEMNQYPEVKESLRAGYL